MWWRNKSIVGFLVLLLLAGITFFVVQQKKSVEHSKAIAPLSTKASGETLTVSNTSTFGNTKIPQKVVKVLRYVRANNKAPNGYIGGREFKNRERKLASKTTTGKKIYYREWDVNPKKAGVNRGAERLVTGNDNSAWYTNNHYKTFSEVIDKL